MSASDLDRQLALRLEELRKEYGDAVKLERVADVVRALLLSVNHGDVRLYKELESLAAYIQQAKEEIASLQPDELRQEVIASATDELDAIVGATEQATNTIMDMADQLEILRPELPPEVGEKLGEVTTHIYEACSFQDITGQRISKVVGALKHIESKLDALVRAFGPEFERPVASQARPFSAAGAPSDEDLLNGPQLPDKAKKQDEIDALFNSIG
ncbi:protein phosphatase CheZ [Telmatospirillum sp. J64-1]|uniref:protein phosphatase CheZ n=1 Tax=Telmatospirillum sp. J64-1 TaxID=2502183 RepID=UPI00115C8F5C|nr:protein phosphatase CheZ [Telmatospirillum sp. J64-1]